IMPLPAISRCAGLNESGSASALSGHARTSMAERALCARPGAGRTAPAPDCGVRTLPGMTRAPPTGAPSPEQQPSAPEAHSVSLQGDSPLPVPDAPGIPDAVPVLMLVKDQDARQVGRADPDAAAWPTTAGAAADRAHSGAPARNRNGRVEVQKAGILWRLAGRKGN